MARTHEAMSKLRTVRARDGATLIPLHDGELASLIVFSEGRVVPARFGIGRVALDADAAPWALPLLAMWRGVAFTDGGGI